MSRHFLLLRTIFGLPSSRHLFSSSYSTCRPCLVLALVYSCPVLSCSSPYYGISAHSHLPNSEALQKLNLPVSVSRGMLGKLELKLSWKNLLTQPVVLALEDVVLLVGRPLELVVRLWHPPSFSSSFFLHSTLPFFLLAALLCFFPSFALLFLLNSASSPPHLPCGN